MMKHGTMAMNRIAAPTQKSGARMDKHELGSIGFLERNIITQNTIAVRVDVSVLFT